LSGNLLHSIDVARQQHPRAGEARAGYVEGAAHRLNGTVI
jgi:hypothetical protein